MALQIIGLLLGISVLMILVFRGLNIFVSTVIASLVILATNGVSWIDGLINGYGQSFGYFATNYIFVLVSGTIFGELMKESGCAESLALFIMKKMGRKNAVLSVIIVTAFFCYAGINGFVLVFTVGPLAISMFDRAKLPIWFLPGVSALGTSIGAGNFPYSLDTLNIIPTTYLGTNLGSAGVLGTIAGASLFALGFIYLKMEEKKILIAQGIDFSDAKSNEMNLTPSRENLPNWKISILPFLIVVALAFITTRYIEAVAGVVLSVSIGIVLALIIGFTSKTLLKENLKMHITNGVSRGTSAMVAAGSIVGFGGAVGVVPAFNELIEIILSLNVHPYIAEVIGLNLVAGVVGSSDAALIIWLENVGVKYLERGVPAAVIHRLAPITSLGFNTLPHNASVAVALEYYGVSYKEGYKYMFVTSVICPIIAAIITMFAALIIYPI